MRWLLGVWGKVVRTDAARAPIVPTGASRLAKLRAMRLDRIDHVSLNTGDREATVRWYREVLGMGGGSGTAETPDDQPVFMGEPGVRLGLFSDRAPGLRHVAFATDEEGQRQLLERLERLGIEHRVEEHRDTRSVYVPDPDGAMIEVLVERS
jgi:catechol 2,3-dioxygenase-like lactoylglutathione lyase family enzyme